MAVKYDVFLGEYYNRMVFQRMHPEQFARFCEYVKNNDLVGEQKEWLKLLVKNSTGYEIDPVTKFYKRKALPDPTEPFGDYELRDDQWVKFYQDLQETFQNMSSDTNALGQNKDAKNFVNNYFGANKLFTYANATPVAENEIQKLKNIIENNKNDVRYILKQNNVLTDTYDIKDLLDDITNKKYNTDLNKQQTLKNVSFYLYNATDRANPNTYSYRDQFDLDIIEQGFKVDPIANNKLSDFKSQYTTILNTLYEKDKIFELFSAKDKSKISAKLRAAREHINYNDNTKEEYLPPKREDELTPAQRFSDWCDNTYDNYLDKYIRFHGDRLFFSPNAKLAVKEISKLNIKPTDGIGKILENKDKILGKLQSKSHSAHKHFKWFASTMDEFKNDPQLSKTFEGALRNGHQMRNLISQVIIKAIKKGEIDEAKTAMEILSVIKYGYTTSKIMDTLAKQDVTILSDKGLSFNKNETIQFITNALDKSIKYAFLGIGYGLTITGNMFQLNGSKFNGNSGKMSKMRQDYNAHSNTERLARQASLNTLHADADKEIANHTANLATLTTNATNLRNQEVTLRNLETDEQTRKREYETEKYQLDALNTTLQPLDQKIKERQEYRASIRQFNQDLIVLNNELAQANAATPPDPNWVNDVQQRINDTNAQISRANYQISLLNNDMRNMLNNPAIRAAYFTTRPGQQRNVVLKKNLYDTALTDRKMLASDINQFKDGTQKIQDLQAQKDYNQQEFDKWDKNHNDTYKQLMAYWDMLETGRDSHTGKMYSWTPFSKKTKQQNFDTNAIYTRFLNNYQMTA